MTTITNTTKTPTIIRTDLSTGRFSARARRQSGCAEPADPGADCRPHVAIFVFSNSVALLADLIHNFGDALTAVPLGIAFFLRSVRGEKLAGLAVVLGIFVSACVALCESVLRFIHPQHLTHLWVLAAAGVTGFVGSALAGVSVGM